MDNINNNNVYKFNLNSRKPTLIPVLEHEGFDETLSDATDLIKSSWNWIQVSVKNISMATPSFDHI